MKKNDWKQLTDDNNKNNYEIIKYPVSGKDFVLFKKDNTELKQRAERFIKGNLHQKLIGDKIVKSQRLTEEDILKHTKETNFVIISNLNNYKNTQSVLVFKHLLCNRVFTRTLSNFKKNKKCPFCYKENRKPVVRTKTTEQFKKDVFKIYGTDYSILSEYTGSKYKIKVKHEKCGTEFQTTAGKFLKGKGYGCPKCYGKSIGEFALKSILTKRNIIFQEQKMFKDLKMEKELLMDFFLENFNLAIEYDGEQHYKPVKIFHDNTSFKSVKKSDKLKELYCKTNNINLLRIPFWEFNNLNKIIDITLLELKNKKTVNQIKNILKKENIFLFKNHYKSFKARKLRELLETPTK